MNIIFFNLPISICFLIVVLCINNPITNHKTLVVEAVFYFLTLHCVRPSATAENFRN
jgi:hypothetical protein